MTLSSFREFPIKGHMDRAKRVIGYLARFKDGSIRFRTEEPDYSELPKQDLDWATTVYGKGKEIIPKDAPVPLEKPVTMTHYYDANLYHDMVTGRSVSGVLHLINQTPIDWYAKKQATVETATYGSEFIAARICVDQIVHFRVTLRYLGVPVRVCYMFGDNESVIGSSSIPHAKLHKRHNALSFHWVREAMACGFVKCFHLRSAHNPADILSKHWGYQQVKDMLYPLLYKRGNTGDLFK